MHTYLQVIELERLRVKMGGSSCDILPKHAICRALTEPKFRDWDQEVMRGVESFGMNRLMIM